MGHPNFDRMSQSTSRDTESNALVRSMNTAYKATFSSMLCLTAKIILVVPLLLRKATYTGIRKHVHLECFQLSASTVKCLPGF